ncbi:MAG: 23S rRNA (uracil(1939)-C(5))-methyltransferase RlmD [Sphaerochaetaceae bacterium]|nr:23S rRNA (uracil(1939)-C(5))-methyltransferase RlmD [Sphaerochaetaceae bacterium]
MHEVKCPLFYVCGGCDYLDIPYGKQLELKQEYLEDYLEKFGTVAPVIPMDNPYHYRNKVQAVFGYDRSGKVISGIYQKGTHRLIEVKGCLLEDEKADEILHEIRSIVKKLSIRLYDEDNHTGFLRHVLIRRSPSTGQIMVIVIGSDYKFSQEKAFVDLLRRKIPEITSIMLNKNDEDTSMVLSDSPERLLWGEEKIEDDLCGLRFKISAKSFYQVNSVQAEKLYNVAIRMALLTGKEKVIDAYCGTGTIGLIAAANNAKSVIGIESNPKAIEDAKENAKLNNIENIEFISDDAGSYVKYLAKKKETVDVVFLDPPRSGSDEKFLASVIRLSPSKIVYISCNAETLERDLRYILKFGPYYVRGIQGVDMFCHTRHVETVVLLERDE